MQKSARNVLCAVLVCGSAVLPIKAHASDGSDLAGLGTIIVLIGTAEAIAAVGGVVGLVGSLSIVASGERTSPAYPAVAYAFGTINLILAAAFFAFSEGDGLLAGLGAGHAVIGLTDIVTASFALRTPSAVELSPVIGEDQAGLSLQLRF